MAAQRRSRIPWYLCLRRCSRAAFCFKRSSKMRRSRKVAPSGVGGMEAALEEVVDESKLKLLPGRIRRGMEDMTPGGGGPRWYGSLHRTYRDLIRVAHK